MPRTDALGDAAWPTQPFPVKPKPIARLSMTHAEVSKISPEAESIAWRSRPGGADGTIHAVQHGAEHLVPRIDRWRRRQRRHVRSGTRDGVRDRRHVATIGQLSAMLSSDVCRHSARPRCLSITTSIATATRATSRPGRSCSASTPTPATSCGAFPLASIRSSPRKGFRRPARLPTPALPWRLGAVSCSSAARRTASSVGFDAMTGKEVWSTSPGFNVTGNAVVYKGANGKQYISNLGAAHDCVHVAVGLRGFQSSYRHQVQTEGVMYRKVLTGLWTSVLTVTLVYAQATPPQQGGAAGAGSQAPTGGGAPGAGRAGRGGGGGGGGGYPTQEQWDGDVAACEGIV